VVSLLLPQPLAGNITNGWGIGHCPVCPEERRAFPHFV
jgi:hypothetical protein